MNDASAPTPPVLPAGASDAGRTPDGSPARPPGRPPRWRRATLWSLLVALLAVAQTLLVALTLRYETWRARDAAEAAADQAVAAIRRDVLRLTRGLQSLTPHGPAAPEGAAAALQLLQGEASLRRIEWRGADGAIAAAVDPPASPPLFSVIPRSELSGDTEQACRDASRNSAPAASRSYFVPVQAGSGVEVVDLCVPARRDGRAAGFVVGTVALPALLESAVDHSRELRQYELTFVESDGARLARAGARRGAGVHVGEQAFDLPGAPMRLRADSLAGHPSLIPNLAVALVLGLSLALFGLVLVLARDVRRRAAAERALAESLAFRKAMENSLSTGLRARDLAGAITYVNPAFCAMVGYSAEELLAVRPPSPPPYWPPERAAQYAERQRVGLGQPEARAPQRQGFETVFMRRNGERFPAMVYEAPLLAGDGRQTGWMSAVLDLTEQRRIEDLSRQQQERLQASARLATVGEMASMLSHELNQPLAAIASYATGSLNLLDDAGSAEAGEPKPNPLPPLRPVLARIAEQAERAGRVIKSVHDFVRRREQQRETIAVDLLLDTVLPLVRLQARKSATQVEIDLPRLPAAMPRVVCDRTMVEQVLLNLARNGIQAMEAGTPESERRLRIRVRPEPDGGRIAIEVADAGPGITDDVAARLFTPFFTTRAEGMGLGLSLCRTVVEQHGGKLEHRPNDEAGGSRCGTVFRFTLPAPRPSVPLPPSAAGNEGQREADAERETGDTR